MTHFTVAALELDRQRNSDLEEFIEIVKGRSVISAGFWDNDRLELGYRGSISLRCL